jgi:hypothetical protein
MWIENIIFDLPIKDSDQHQYSDFKPKKLFSYFKSIRKDNSGVSSLWVWCQFLLILYIFWSRLEQLDLLGLSSLDGILYTDTVEKTNILNQQFQSVFTHDPPHDIPDKGPSPHPIMEQILVFLPVVFVLFIYKFA